ncbi:MAG: GNAT family N-acetyltransferase [Thermomicrobiales bacterium]
MLIATGFPTAALNWAFVAERPADPHAALVAARAFFTRLGLPWRLVAWETLGAALAPIAAATGFSERPPEPAMLLAPLADSTPHTSVNLMVQPVADTATLRAYNDVFAAAFDLPTEGIDLVFNPAILTVPNATLLLGWADGKPVGIGLGLTSHHIAGIFAIGVLPTYRRRGFGEALTWDTVQSCGRDASPPT